MTHDINLILTLTFGLGVALVLGYLAKRLKLSPIVGYLLAGIVVGPHTPGFIADASLSGQLAEVGVILLMFGVGLHFHAHELLAVRKVAIPGAIIQSSIATLIGFFVCQAFGWDWVSSLIFGIAISVTSTVVLTRVLADNRLLHSPDGHIAVGWLIIEDILTILALVIIPIFFGKEAATANHSDPWQAALSIGLVFVKLGVLFALALLGGKRLIPAFLGYISKTGSRELFTLAVLVIALGIAVGSSLLFGASMALGAFLAGMIVRQSDFSTRAASEAMPMRDAFAVLFFVSVGMMFDPLGLIKDWPFILAVLGIVLFGKTIVAFLLVLLLRRPLPSALRIAAALGQIGEFSFILASLTIELGILPLKAMNVLVAVAMLTIACNPLYFHLAKKLAERAEKRRKPESSLGGIEIPDAAAHRMILVGYGPVGQVLRHILGSNGIHVTIIEMNLETVKGLRERGIAAIYGDASSRETLEAAGIETARGLIVSAPGIPGFELTRLARELNPAIQIVFRTDFLSDVPVVRGLGVNAVFSGEGEVAMAMAAYIMKQLGSTDELIAQERERLRNELLGD